MNKGNTIEDCCVLELPKIEMRAGSITFVEGSLGIPFEIRRVYYLYDIPGGKTRGAHAHRRLEQLIVAASGSFEVTLDDGTSTKSIRLDRPYKGLYLKSGIWRDLNEFSSGAICLVLASEVYDQNDYIRDYEEFLRFKNVQ